MTFNNIYDYFKNDEDLLRYFDPESSARNNAEACMEIYHKLIEHTKERTCKFVRDDIGYIFYSEGLLISFCVKPEFRDKYNLSYFGNLIKKHLGQRFKCYLYNQNERALTFLDKLGMKKEASNELITLLTL